MRTSFYLPVHHLPSPQGREAWRTGGHIVREQRGKGGAAESWIYQSWNALMLRGHDVALAQTMPTEGIVIALSGTLPDGFTPPAGVFLAAVVADGLPHPGAHVQILQNKTHGRLLPGSVYMPHWPQTNLLPRDPARGGSFRTACFFGHTANLDPQLASEQWQSALRRRTGLAFLVRAHEQWHDYHDIDAVVAVRPFHGGRHLHKPATKLYNAWLAGVPFVGGTDSAFQAEGRPGEDYLMARSAEEVTDHLQRLARDPDLRHRLVEAGRVRAKEFTREAATKRWEQLVLEELPARAAAWHALRAPAKRIRTLARRGWLFADRLLRR
jgi:hypothetical protein